jgi:hypothetical protein
VRSLDQRQKTIVKVTQCIVEKQHDFFEKGIEHLKPMILRDVAEAVGMHESTISRVTTNKYVHTPRGIFELKYFFNSSIRRIAEEDIASESVKQAIKKIIGEEDAQRAALRRADRQEAGAARRSHRPAHRREVPRDAGHFLERQAQAVLLARRESAENRAGGPRGAFLEPFQRE